MFINHINKDLFIHIPKTGGTSITQCYVDNYGSYDDGDGYTLLNRIHENQKKWDVNGHVFIRDLIDVIDLTDYNTFAVIRNPFELVVSHYFYSIQHPKYDYKDTFDNFISLMISPDAVRNPMVDYISDSAGNILVKNILRYETLNEDFFNLTGLSLDKYNLNVSSHLHYSKYYTNKTKKIVEDYFRSDLDKFGYEF